MISLFSFTLVWMLQLRRVAFVAIIANLSLILMALPTSILMTLSIISKSSTVHTEEITYEYFPPDAAAIA